MPVNRPYKAHFYIQVDMKRIGMISGSYDTFQSQLSNGNKHLELDVEFVPRFFVAALELDCRVLNVQPVVERSLQIRIKAQRSIVRRKICRTQCRQANNPLGLTVHCKRVHTRDSCQPPEKPKGFNDACGQDVNFES